jgi:hypothetical protein
MILDLTDEETALTRLLSDIIDGDRYPFSPRIQTFRAILAKIRPEPVREPLPPLKHYEPPRATVTRRLSQGPLVFRSNHMIHQRGAVGWVEQRETHRNERRRWVSLSSTHPTGILHDKNG